MTSERIEAERALPRFPMRDIVKLEDVSPRFRPAPAIVCSITMRVVCDAGRLATFPGHIFHLVVFHCVEILTFSEHH